MRFNSSLMYYGSVGNGKSPPFPDLPASGKALLTRIDNASAAEIVRKLLAMSFHRGFFMTTG
jgi:hypothetical protein